MSTSDSTLRDDYDALPYVSMPITYSQPSHLAAQARLFGVDAPPAKTASVLEIGAASGGNIIPLAVRFPAARFLGIDLAETHVALGQRRIADLGLTNVTLVHGDIAHAALGATTFDYVICHGVFSWAPEAARRGILKVCSDTLGRNGIAAISYNVFPGWHARNVIRDICLEHTRGSASPREKVAAVRALLAQLAEASSEGDPYGLILRTEAARLSARPASYILGELLAASNDPFHARDFIRQAGEFGLAYLCEADLMSSLPEFLAPKAAANVRKLAGDDRLAVEHYADVFSGRTFRRSLLVRAGQAASQPAPERLAGLHVAANLKATRQGLADSRDRPLKVDDPAVLAALTRLANAYPASVPISDLVSTPRDPVIAALYRLAGRGRASLSALPLRVGAADQARPRVWDVARADALSGQPWVTSLQHTPVLVSPVLRALVPLMDGNADRAGLVRALTAALRDGLVSAADLPEGSQGNDQEQRVASALDSLVTYCARSGLLEP